MRKVIKISAELVISFGATQLVTLQHVAGELLLKIVSEDLKLEKLWKIKADKSIYAALVFDFAMWLASPEPRYFDVIGKIEKYTLIENDRTRN